MHNIAGIHYVPQVLGASWPISLDIQTRAKNKMFAEVEGKRMTFGGYVEPWSQFKNNIKQFHHS